MVKTKSRREKLRSLVQARGFAALGELAESLGVSESTIRRDLEQLENSGDARRTHGGVFWTGNPSTMRVFGNRRDTMWKAKSAIGRIAAEVVEDHDTILLDGGSTTYELARHLVKRPLQVVTNSLPVAHLLSSSESIDLIMIGGSIRGRTAVAIGPIADTMLHGLNVTKVFLSVAGITERGFFNSDMMLVESEKAMMKAADQIFVVTDSSKFGKVSLSRICGLGDVNAVITDSDIGNDWKKRLETACVGLILASTANESVSSTARSRSAAQD